ncbi:MAG: AmmeMemoRadiSam system radical SAM enzyme [Deltaproteobacteria bacterium]|nr:MAG: AmmeMemoRadiSam system radical SAM enzyme [Deltaproteobacteria bacterium]
MSKKSPGLKKKIIPISPKKLVSGPKLLCWVYGKKPLLGGPGTVWKRGTRVDICPRQCKLRGRNAGFVFWWRGSQPPIGAQPNPKKEPSPNPPFPPGGNLPFLPNWDISKSREFDRLTDSASPEAIAEAAQSHGCRSVAFTYNDPVIFLEYAVDIARECRERGVRSVAVTAGYVMPEARREFFNWMDAANIDLKGFTESFYRETCGGSLAPVLDTLEYLKHETEVWFEVTTLLIPGYNDSGSELEKLSCWMVEQLGPEVPLHFSAFHPDWKMTDVERTPHQTLIRAREIALANGIHHVYLGNVHDHQGSSTYCHACGQILIGRDWYVLSDWNLDSQGRCSNCLEPCPGHFEPTPGSWGSRRQPVQV